jgi:hypothetical protein
MGIFNQIKQAFDLNDSSYDPIAHIMEKYQKLLTNPEAYQKRYANSYCNDEGIRDLLWELGDKVECHPEYVGKAIECCAQIFSMENIFVSDQFLGPKSEKTRSALLSVVGYHDGAGKAVDVFVDRIFSKQTPDKAVGTFSQALKVLMEYGYTNEVMTKIAERLSSSEQLPQQPTKVMELLTKGTEKNPKWAETTIDYLSKMADRYGCSSGICEALWKATSCAEYTEKDQLTQKAHEVAEKMNAAVRINEFNCSSDVEHIYYDLRLLAEDKHADGVWKTLAEVGQSKYNTPYSLARAYAILGNNFGSQAAHPDKWAEAFKQTLLSDKNGHMVEYKQDNWDGEYEEDDNSLRYAMSSLTEQLQSHPECADTLKELVEIAVCSDKNDESTKYDVRYVTQALVRAKPVYLEDAIAMRRCRDEDADVSDLKNIAQISYNDLQRALEQIQNRMGIRGKDPLDNDRCSSSENEQKMKELEEKLQQNENSDQSHSPEELKNEAKKQELQERKDAFRKQQKQDNALNNAVRQTVLNQGGRE